MELPERRTSVSQPSYPQQLKTSPPKARPTVNLNKPHQQRQTPAMSYITVAAATITSVPLDFKGNLTRILESIRLAKEQGAKLRTGPEVCE